MPAGHGGRPQPTVSGWRACPQGMPVSHTGGPEPPQEKTRHSILEGFQVPASLGSRRFPGCRTTARTSTRMWRSAAGEVGPLRSMGQQQAAAMEMAGKVISIDSCCHGHDCGHFCDVGPTRVVDQRQLVCVAQRVSQRVPRILATGAQNAVFGKYEMLGKMGGHPFSQCSS